MIKIPLPYGKKFVQVIPRENFDSIRSGYSYSEYMKNLDLWEWEQMREGFETFRVEMTMGEFLSETHKRGLPLNAESRQIVLREKALALGLIPPDEN